jgi:hypothetical protein
MKTNDKNPTLKHEREYVDEKKKSGLGLVESLWLIESLRLGFPPTAEYFFHFYVIYIYVFILFFYIEMDFFFFLFFF